MFSAVASFFRTIRMSIFIVMLSPSLLRAQIRQDNFFKDGERVNFIGNSITHGGEFHSYIILYYATRFPSQKVTFYNSGIWGDSANQFLKRMDKDILTNKADYAVVMAGMNDVNRVLYSDKRKHEPDIEKQRQDALNNYRNNLEKVILRLRQEGMKIIIQKPSIYDQTAKMPMENMSGVNDALAKCCLIIDDLAGEYQLQVVDYYTPMNQVNIALQKKDSSATIVSYDRIHPATPGSFLMAAEFLKQTLSPAVVSSVSITKRRQAAALHCKLSGLSFQKDSVMFDLDQESLPFPIPGAAEEVAGLIGFDEALNKQLIKIDGLKKGSYTLYIDQERVATFTSAQLKRGVNLAPCRTPQARQAQEVAKQVAAYRQAYRGLRDIKIVEINFLPEIYYGATEQKTMNYIDQLKASSSSIYTKNTYYFNLYFKSKPIESHLKNDLVRLRQSIYQSAQPLRHSYKLKRELQPPSIP